MKKCPYCAMEIPEEARICAHCRKTVSPLVKNKWKAVMLAIFFGPLSWLYTWKWDKNKFVSFLSIWTIFAIGWFIFGITQLFSAGYSLGSSLTEYHDEIMFALKGVRVFFLPVYLPFGIWASITAWLRGRDKYFLY